MDHLLQAQLSVRQRSKKQKQHQDIYSHSSLLSNLPNSRTSNPSLPIQEGGASSHPSTSKASTQSEDVLVATFSSIISHEHFLNEELVSRPYLKLVFTLTQYRLE